MSYKYFILPEKLGKDEGKIVSFEYDERGYFNRYINPNGYTTEMTHDDAGRILTLAEDGVIQFENEFDDTARIIRQTDALGHPTYFHYDKESCPSCIVTTLTKRIGNKRILVHNEDLRLIGVQAEDGGVTRYTYNDKGQEGSVTNPLGETIRYRYDDDGHLIEQIDPLGNSTYYTYTTDHRIESEADAAGNR